MKSRTGIILLVVLALIGAGAAAIFWFRADIATRIVQRAATQALSGSLTDDLPDGLHAVFCGTGSPFPDRSRAGPCFAAIAGGHVFVFDAGEGAAETLSLMGVSPGSVERVFLTHLHSDHFDGLAPMALQHWVNASAQSPLVVSGPEGTARVVAGLNEAYTIDSTYRIAHHGERVVPPSGFGLAATEFVFPAGQADLIVYDADGVRITAFPVNHAPINNAVGYRIDYAGRSIVVSGDTARADSVERAAQGVDLLVHDVLSMQLNTIMGEAANANGRQNIGAVIHDVRSYHASPEDAGAVAQAAGVGALAMTHLVPPTPVPGLDAVFVRAARSTFNGPVWAMRDGDVVSLPRDGGMIRSHRLR
ncbi:MAG TPA: MBL fold metallo-hydrolase [Verrucomicrobiae bacterium]|nr:MBL fold metallo-hydrolase [Verrucomicrobiae bacterium]